MNSKTGFSFLFLSCFALLQGCGGGSSDPVAPVVPVEDEPTVLTGALGASPITGVAFSTDTQSGTTGVSGEYQYIEGETVTFSIGSLSFPAVTAAPVITALDMGGSAIDPVTTATNITRLLQSLDTDGYPYNGINIPTGAAASSAPVNFSVSTANFEISPIVINMVANSGAFNSSLTSLQNATIQLNQITTLEDFEEKIVGKRLVQRLPGGGRVENTQFEFQTDGTLARFGEGGILDSDADLSWYWDGQFYCRFGSVGGTQRPLDCQLASVISPGIVSLVAQRGRGDASNWFIGN